MVNISDYRLISLLLSKTVLEEQDYMEVTKPKLKELGYAVGIRSQDVIYVLC